MTRRYYNKLALLVKLEIAYGTDAGPNPVNNVMLGIDVQFTPLDAQELDRELILPYLGHRGVILDRYLTRIEFSVEMAGAGNPGAVPPYGPLLRVCGMSQVATAGQKVEYEPVSSNFEAVTVYYNRDGTRHVMLGARGTWRTEIAPTTIPRFRFTLTGLQGVVADVALPVVNTAPWITPVPVNKTNSDFTIFGYQPPLERLTIDLGNQVEPRMLVNAEGIEITDRRVTGSMVIEATQAAAIDWMGLVKSHTLGEMAFAHGQSAGNAVRIESAAVQLGPPAEGQSQRILTNTMAMMIRPTAAGNDDLTVTVR